MIEVLIVFLNCVHLRIQKNYNRLLKPTETNFL